MTSGNGDRPDPQMDINTVVYLRLLPVDKECEPEYQSGISLFMSEAAMRHDAYFLAMSEHDARRLAQDIIDHYDGEIDISNPEPNYGRD